MKPQCDNDVVPALADHEWDKLVNGTWSKSDRKMFDFGFRAGYYAGRRQLRKELERESTEAVMAQEL